MKCEREGARVLQINEREGECKERERERERENMREREKREEERREEKNEGMIKYNVQMF